MLVIHVTLFWHDARRRGRVRESGGERERERERD